VTDGARQEESVVTLIAPPVGGAHVVRLMEDNERVLTGGRNAGVSGRKGDVHPIPGVTARADAI